METFPNWKEDGQTDGRQAKVRWEPLSLEGLPCSMPGAGLFAFSATLNPHDSAGLVTPPILTPGTWVQKVDQT